jgi:hypothetical protein
MTVELGDSAGVEGRLITCRTGTQVSGEQNRKDGPSSHVRYISKYNDQSMSLPNMRLHATKEHTTW